MIERGRLFDGTLVGTELACGSQAFIATLLFDPSMSALPIIPKQNSVSVGLFTHLKFISLLVGTAFNKS